MSSKRLRTCLHLHIVLLHCRVHLWQFHDLDTLLPLAQVPLAQVGRPRVAEVQGTTLMSLWGQLVLDPVSPRKEKKKQMITV